MFWRHQKFCTPNRASKPSVSTEHEVRPQKTIRVVCQSTCILGLRRKMKSIIACTFSRRAILFGVVVVLLARVVVLSGELHSTSAHGQVSESSVLSYEVKTPNYQIDASGVQVPGYARNDMPGAPTLPVWSILVDLPPAGAWEISHQSLGERLLDQVAVVPAVPAPNLELASTAGWKAADLPNSVPVVDRPDLSIYGVNAFYPTSPVVAGEVQWQGGRRLLPLRVFPFQYNPVTHRLRYHPDLRVTVQISPRWPVDSQADRDERPGEPASSGLDTRDQRRRDPRSGGKFCRNLYRCPSHPYWRSRSLSPYLRRPGHGRSAARKRQRGQLFHVLLGAANRHRSDWGRGSRVRAE